MSVLSTTRHFSLGRALQPPHRPNPLIRVLIFPASPSQKSLDDNPKTFRENPQIQILTDPCEHMIVFTEHTRSKTRFHSYNYRIIVLNIYARMMMMMMMMMMMLMMLMMMMIGAPI
jgi:hypothetical protein